MNVTITIPCLNIGGTERQTLYLAKSLIQSGHKVSVICSFEWVQVTVDEFEAAGTVVTLMRLSRGISPLQYISALRRCIIGTKPDVIHVQYMAPGALAVIAARSAGPGRLFATVHQPYSSWHNRLWKVLLRGSAVLCDHFISVSEGVERSWFDKVSGCDLSVAGGSPIPKHLTIHNAVDIGKVRSLADYSTGVKLRGELHLGKEFVFGYVGRISYEKGVDVLLEAFGMLFEQNNGARLLIVGDGPERAQIEKRFSGEPWWERVIFLGSQSWENAMRYLAVADAFVVPSRFEGFGLSAVEALAASKPVIASRTGGLVEIIEEGKNGYLYETENTVELASLMRKLLEDPDKCETLSQNGQTRAAEFDVLAFDRKIDNLYKQG